uniref:SPK domain-containing protein n=1 Tax=Caenorhabditis japonica TaxID=281687 RepID=A0A8R1HL88_CAEJA
MEETMKRKANPLNLADLLKNNSFEEDFHEQKPPISGLFSISYGAEAPLTSPSPKPVGKRTIFSVQKESLSIYRFLLTQIRSQTDGRAGRIAKRKVDTSSVDFWEKYKKWSSGTKNAKDYRVHYRVHCPHLHDFSYLTLQEKIDLYYALDIKIPRQFRQKLIDKFHVEINEDGVITGNYLLDHWDLIHSDSEKEDEQDSVDGEKPKKPVEKWQRFTEKDDGMMWEFVLEHVKNFREPFQNGKRPWEEFKRLYKHRGVSTKRAASTYSQRFSRILAPNLHRMPFDIETKAAIYENLCYYKFEVPEEFRDQLIAETGVEISPEGFVTKYPNRPENLVLQSKKIDDVIGFTSPHRISMLAHPKPILTKPWTAEEDKQIWNYVLLKMRNKFGQIIRAKNRLGGWLIWREFIKDHKSDRTWQSLSQHFNDDFIDDFMFMDFPLKEKIQMLYILNIPLSESTRKIVEAATTFLLLDDTGSIEFAQIGKFRVGKHEKPQKKIGELGEIGEIGENVDDEEHEEEEMEEMIPDLEMAETARILENFAKAGRKMSIPTEPVPEMEESCVGQDVAISQKMFTATATNVEEQERQKRKHKKYATDDGALTVDNIRDFMNKIAASSPEPPKKRATYSTRPSTSTTRRDYDSDEDFHPPPFQPRSSHLITRRRGRPSRQSSTESVGTRLRIEEILRIAARHLAAEQNQYDAEIPNFAPQTEPPRPKPLNLDDLAENAEILARNMNMMEREVKMEPIDDYEQEHGNFSEFTEKKPEHLIEERRSPKPGETRILRAEKAQDLEENLDDLGEGPSNLNSINAAFDRIENEMRVFARSLKSGGGGGAMTPKLKLGYLEKIEQLAKTFRQSSRDALNDSL